MVTKNCEHLREKLGREVDIDYEYVTILKLRPKAVVSVGPYWPTAVFFGPVYFLFQALVTQVYPVELLQSLFTS
jgi:hypothetical protein